jgi:hypothetical protein
MSAFARTLSVVLAASACSCTGVIADADASHRPAGGPDGVQGEKGEGELPTNDIPEPDAEGNIAFSPPTPVSPALQARTWKLTHEQYRRSIEQLLGVTVSLVDAQGEPRLEPEIDSGVFRNLSQSGFVSVPLAEGYFRLAEEVVQALTRAELGALIPCGEVAVSCRDDFLKSAISRAFRRPATSEDLARFSALFDGAQALATALDDPSAGFRAVLRGLLNSPYFLYRTEIGRDAAELEFALTDYEAASFLSYSVLGSPPSAALLELASQGKLGDVASLGAIVPALLSEPAATAEFSRFLQEWLEIPGFEDPDVVRKDLPTFDGVRAAMLEETRSFLDVHGGLQGGLGGLLTAEVPPASGALATFYASGGVTSGTKRTGVLALGTIMSKNSKEGATSPTLRGLFVRERLLCQDFVVPPDVPAIEEAEAREQPETTRELYELHASSPACATCHTLIDGVGLTFEDLDEVGRPRASQNGVAIDTSGNLLNTDVNTALRDHADLAAALARSEWVRECLSRQAFRFYFGLATSAERSADGTRERENRGLPPIQAGRAALGATGRMLDMVTSILTSQSTLARSRVEPAQPKP